ncbi:hypothetical protein AJ80_03365 [Polytolypa hystricis UAMH7299]|uniref:tRNA (adenine(58)-N(1))-methyltransferase non-catalytic subunit TRM6 n=1 Tax=Polytolypa hystricis (strain UAMH7299) TaxID=1447883 RepID=A0A2B7YJ41_POLH7|nr:hypothetical protein AJ80_03365 [Polytolypa hystricis UAMH7299]
MNPTVQPNAYVALQLPSDSAKVVQIVPNTTIHLGKYGSFPTNQILGRPYYLTFELLNEPEADGHALRIVTAAELHTEALLSEDSTPGDADEGDDIAGESEKDGAAATTMRTNRNIVDDATTQQMTMEEIEALKKEATGSGKDIIAKLLQSHSALDQKSAFSLAKYTLRKRKKYLKRFTVLPLDVPALGRWMLEQKDAAKIMELRDEIIGLIGCWANVHHGGHGMSADGPTPSQPTGRWLVIDDTAGLVVAAMAERMGILYPSQEYEPEHTEGDRTGPEDGQAQSDFIPSTQRRIIPGMSAKSTTITLLHANPQPNLSMLQYFGFDNNDPVETHPLHTHLKTVSWMQLLDPLADAIYANEPTVVTDATLATWKPSKRGVHHRKRRRWARVRSVVDETRAGGFDGLVVASLMDPASILRHAVPLLAGSAPVVVYSPYVEPLVNLVDVYSTARRTAYINLKRTLREPPLIKTETTQTPDSPAQIEEREKEGEESSKNHSPSINDEDFPVDPTLLLAPTIHTSRVRPWQVLPGRTHPHMTGRGGAEGYVFHAIRAFPAEGKVEARGVPGRKKRKVAVDTPATSSRNSEAAEGVVVSMDDVKESGNG